MPQAGVACPEVVEREAGALFFEFGSDAIGVLGIADESTLCDLKNETVEREAGLLGGGADVFGEREIGELGEGDIDRKGKVIGDVFCSVEGGAKEVAGEQPVESGRFGEWNEFVGWDKAAAGMLPSR